LSGHQGGSKLEFGNVHAWTSSNLRVIPCLIPCLIPWFRVACNEVCGQNVRWQHVAPPQNGAWHLHCGSLMILAAGQYARLTAFLNAYCILLAMQLECCSPSHAREGNCVHRCFKMLQGVVLLTISINRWLKEYTWYSLTSLWNWKLEVTPMHIQVNHDYTILVAISSPESGGAGTPKIFDSGEPSCTPTLLQNQRPWAGKHPKTTNFGHVWTVIILVGPWFCKWGPQCWAESVQNLTFWSGNWFCRHKAGDTLRSLNF